MSFVFEEPRASQSDTFAGGEASIGDIYSASYDQFQFGNTVNQAQLRMERVFDDRSEEVFKATGVKILNPMRATHGFPSLEGVRDLADPVGRFMAQVEEAAKRIPDTTVVDRLTRSIEGDAIRLAKESDEKAASLMASRPGIGKYLAGFAGSAAAMVRDPVQGPMMLIGAGPGAARTVAGRIFETAAREAAINGATEASLQPLIQYQRAQAGLSHGLGEAVGNIAFAAGLGGLLGGASQGIGELGARAAGRAVSAEAGELPANATPTKQVMPDRLDVESLRERLPAETRGALDAVETLDHLDVSKPAAAHIERHDMAVSEAHQAIEQGRPPRFQADPDQVDRVTRAMIGEDPVTVAPGSRPQSLVQFLQARGGVLDHAGELDAIGAGSLSRNRARRGSPDRREPLDEARRAAEDAGYIGRAGETQTTTVADLLGAIEAETRGAPVYSRADEGQLAEGIDEARYARDRAGAERVVAEVAEAAGPAVDDAIIHEAAEIAMREGVDVYDALDRIFVRAEQTGRTFPSVRVDEILPPGWSDAELDALSASRGVEPHADPRSPFDDPAAADNTDDFLISEQEATEFADVLIPGEDGRVISMADYLADIADDQDMIATVKACRA